MTKYSFFIFYKEYDNFINDIKDRGAIHILEKKIDPTFDVIELIDKIDRVDKTLKRLHSLDKDVFGEIKGIESSKVSLEEKEGDLDKWSDEVNLLLQFRDDHKAKLHKIERKIERANLWGNFNSSKLKEIRKDTGLNILFFEGDKSFEFGSLDENENILYKELIDETSGGTKLFILVCDKKYDKDLLSIAGKEIDIVDLEELRIKEGSLKKELEIVDLKIVKVIKSVELYETRAKELRAELDLLNVRAYTDQHIEGTLLFLEGWIPANREVELDTFLDASGAYYFKSRAKVEDMPPVLLKNNAFSRLFEPIGELFSLPKYGEVDLTALFAPFFMLFFGFCFGDAGYGVLIILATFIFSKKIPAKFKSAVQLARLLSLSAILFGALTGSMFGINLSLVDWPFLEGVREKFLQPGEMFNLALILGGIQILFGMCIKVVNQYVQFGWKYAITPLGWLLLFLTSGVIFSLNTLGVNAIGFDSIIFKIVLGISAVMVLFFNVPNKNPAVNVGLGVWESYNMATSILGDMLSYIRLFALGLSSGVLGGVFNSLALGMMGDIPVVSQIIMVLILAFGHSINIFMSILGSMIHPMRLTFVEFYKNAGFSGGGKAYKPLKK